MLGWGRMIDAKDGNNNSLSVCTVTSVSFLYQNQKCHFHAPLSRRRDGEYGDTISH